MPVDIEPTTRCAELIRSAAELALHELEASHPQPARDDDDAGDFRLQRADLEVLQRSLLASGQPENVLAGHLLITPNAEEAGARTTEESPWRDLARRAIETRSPILAWHALRSCAASPQPCLLETQEQDLLDIDRQNAASWVLVATLRHRRGDVAGALMAMQGAASAPTSTYYWPETIGLIERALASQSPMHFFDRFNNAFGSAAAAALPQLSHLSRMCREGAVTNRAWGEACHAVGVLQGTKNETMLARSFSYALREEALRAMGDVERAAAVAEERERETARSKERLSDTRIAMSTLQSTLIASDPARFHAYLADIRRLGEEAGGHAFLRQQVPLLLERAGNPAQEETSRCLARLIAPSKA